jgi:hypothetical protein
MLTQEEFRVFAEQVASAELLADRLSNANRPGDASQVMALRQSLRACVTRAVDAGSALYEADQVLSAALKEM